MISEQMKEIYIEKEFSKYPAGRYINDGDSSGQAFRESHLVPALKDNRFSTVLVVFDGVAGFGSSFLEEAFGGLIRESYIEKSVIDDKLQISTNEGDLEDFVKLAKKYITDAAISANS